MVSSLMVNMLNDVFQDPYIQGLPELVAREPIPYFRAISADEGPAASPDNGSVSNSAIESSPDFLNAVEVALEGTIYNLMQEIEKGEFDCTTYPMLVTKREFAALTAKLNK
ncbi:hypothetical protein HDU91_000718 [Kappamyces sp. JEL0680]|nr:hypothetical protein HDU91_000718 [Kappamyces sp. JEL0680]